MNVGALLVAWLALVAFGRRGAGGGGRVRGSAISYGDAELAKLRARWDGELGQIVREWVHLGWPEADPEVMALCLLGFTSTVVSWTENTTEAPRLAGGRQPFHEIGIGNVPAGPWNGPAPNPDPRAANNAWGALAHSDLVTRLLGRAATMEPNAWKTAHRDQVAVWWADQQRNAASVRAGLHAGLRPATDTWSPYRVGLMFAGFSTGPSGTAAAFNRHDELADVAERGRWRAARGAALSDSRLARVIYGADTKLESARALAAAIGSTAFAAWWASDSQTPDEAARLAASARG